MFEYSLFLTSSHTTHFLVLFGSLFLSGFRLMLCAYINRMFYRWCDSFMLFSTINKSDRIDCITTIETRFVCQLILIHCCALWLNSLPLGLVFSIIFFVCISWLNTFESNMSMKIYRISEDWRLRHSQVVYSFAFLPLVDFSNLLLL